jgi:hypothetical protein
MSLESYLHLRAESLVKQVIFADITLEICMIWPCPMQHVCDSGCCQFLAPFGCRWWLFSPLLAAFISATVQ